MPDRLTTDIIDAELAPGARNAIRVCLRLQPRSASRLSPTRRRARSRRRCRRKSKKWAPITPSSFSKIMRSARSRACRRSFWMIWRNRRSRSLRRKPRPVNSARASQMTAVVNKHHIRHGHMVNINRQIMLRRNARRFHRGRRAQPAPGRARAAQPNASPAVPRPGPNLKPSFRRT